MQNLRPIIGHIKAYSKRLNHKFNKEGGGVMRKYLLIVVALTLCSILLFPPQGNAIELKFNSMYAPKHPINTHAFSVWAKEVERRTEGRVKVTLFPSNALANVKQAYDATISGICDIAVSCPTYAPDRFPLSTVINLPMLGTSSAVTNSLALWELYEKFPQLQKEYKDVKLLWLYANPTFQLHFRKDLVKKLEDLRGRVISTGSAMGLKILKKLGAVPENIPMVDVYMALQKGVVDGCMLPYAPLKSQRIAELVHYHTNADLLCVSFYVVMNLDKWNKLSPQDQKIISELTGRYGAELCGSVFDKFQDRDIKWMLQRGDKFYTLPAQERERWVKRVAPLREDWVKKMEKRGLPARRVMEEAQSLIKKYRAH